MTRTASTLSIEADLIHEYTNWAHSKKREALDTTPEQFLKDRAKETAYRRLIILQDEAQACESGDLEVNAQYVLEIISGAWDSAYDQAVTNMEIRESNNE